MTVSSTISQETFNCDGSTDEFTCPFRVLSADDVLGYLITAASGDYVELENGVDFTVSNVGEVNCTVTTTDTYSGDYQVRFRRRTERLQETDYRDNDTFPAETHEAALDRLTMIVQEHDDDLERAVLVPAGASEGLTNITLPLPGATKFIRWNADGTALEAAPAVYDNGNFLQSGTGAVVRTVNSKLAETVSIFDFMTEVQRNDVMGLVGSVDCSAAVQKAMDYAAITQRELVGWGRVRLESKLNPYTSIRGTCGGEEQGAGLRFVWMGSDDRVFEFLGEDVQGWRFENFRIDCQFTENPVEAMMYFSQGLHGGMFRNLCFRGAHTGGFTGGEYFDQNAIVFIGGDGTTSKYDVSQNHFEHLSFVRTGNCIEITDSVPTGEAPGNSNTLLGIIAICNGFVFKSPGSNNFLANIECFIDDDTAHGLPSGGRALVLDGGNAFGWELKNFDADGLSGASGWEPIRANTAGDVSLIVWEGGINWPRSAVVPNPVSDAGTGTKGQRYRIHNVNNADSTTDSVNAVKAAQWIATWNRSAPDGVNIDFSGSATLTPSGSMTLGTPTTAPAQYEISNKMMHLTLKSTFTVGGTPDTKISFTIPGSKTSAMAKRVPCIVKTGGSFVATGIVEVTSSGTAVNCYVDGAGSNWSAGAGSIEVDIRFPIQ